MLEFVEQVGAADFVHNLCASTSQIRLRNSYRLHSARGSAVLCGMLLAVSAPADFFCSSVRSLQTDAAKPVVVQPGAPGKPSKCASSGDDGADSVACGKQGVAIAGGANQ
ncbi:MAG: hypothetical protein AUH16_00015 [Acidobacteria bacterium 13_2_20CM_57_7]|nr:MAG: hypothetical protein AUH16_00015 [Acidobacteria bacterium 13_2_20CM_57_7]